MTTELMKALTASGADALMPYTLDPVLTEELLNIQPLARLLDTVPAEGLTHEYRLKTSHPMAWFEGETADANEQNGSYSRATVQLKIARIWGSVGGFTQAVTAKFINTLAEEISGSLQGMADLMEYGVMHGCAPDAGFTGDAYQYTGIIPRVFAHAPGNVVDAGSAKITLAMLDSVLAKTTRHRQTRNDPGLWLMGLQMKQVVDGLQSKVQIPLTSVTLADGKIEMAAYANRGILETDYLVPDESTSSPAVSAAQGDATGALSAATYTYQIASVTAYGEQAAGTASSGVVADATHKNINLTWTADPKAKLYMVFRKEGAGAFQLLDIINALTYDANGKVNGSRTTYQDNGSKTPKAIKPLLAGEQQVLYANTNPARGAAFVGMVDDMGERVDNLVSMVELARTKDSYDYMLKSYLALRIKYPNLFGVLRHVKLA